MPIQDRLGKQGPGGAPKVSGVLARIARRFAPYASAADVMRPNEKFRSFVWRASGMHQIYVSAIAISVALANFVPIDLQRRVVDIAITNRDVRALLVLGGLYLAAILVYAGLKYALIVYQGWVGESVVKAARDQLALVATERSALEHARIGQTASIIGSEIDDVGVFVGTSISGCVVDVTMMISVALYMIY